MATKPQIRVPREATEPLSEFVRLPEDEFEKLASALTSEPRLIQRRDLLTRASNEVGADVSSILDTLLSLDLLRASHGWNPAQAASAVAQAEGLPQDLNRPQLEERLARCLGTPSLSATAKAIDVVSSNERLFTGARIYTDMRPVFGDDPTQPPIASVVVHLMEVSFQLSTGRTEHFYVALDDQDLIDLAMVIERAQAKAVTIRSLVERVGIEVIDLNGDET